MSTPMKAAYFDEYGELDNIKIGELDRPEPSEGEVLVKVKAAGVNPVDAAVARGMLDQVIPGKFPAIPGWDIAGEVVENGHSARRFKEGDQVYAYARRPEIKHGTFAEYIALPESYLAKTPEKLSVEESAGLPLVGLTAFQSLFVAGDLKEDQTLLILGASGGVGSVAIQLAKHINAKVIAVASKKNHDYMKELGADVTIDYNSEDLAEKVTTAAGGKVDFIFHCSRGDSLDNTKNTLKENGTLISITNSSPDLRDDIQFQYVFVEPNAPQLEQLAKLADMDELKLSVFKTYTLDEAAQALQDVESLHAQGKRVITM